MKVIRKIFAVILTVLTVLVLLFTVGTVIPQLPVFGSVANFVTVAFMHFWLPACVGLFVITLLLCLSNRTRSGLYIADLVMASLSTIMSAVIVIVVSGTLHGFGVRANFFPAKEDVSSVVTETEVYTVSDTGDVELNVYHCSDGTQGKPIMIYIHGGGWIFGSKEDHEYYSKVFAEKGYVVFSADYDLSSAERHLASSTEKQLLEAFAWVKKHAAEYGADPARLYVTGGSAGGNLALDIAFKINSGEYAASADGTELPRVTAVSVTFPVASPEDFYRNNDLILGRTASKMARSYTGCAPEENPELYSSIKPANHVSVSSPAVLLFLGRGDTLVPPQATYELASVLNEAAVPNRLIAVPFGNHMLEMAEGGMLCNAYLETTLRWFEEYR